ncbi:hypothetical protein EEB12_29125 [Rhodococcus sp. WS1]|nr:hypothetical protein EEB12_29125 [Rhodococcus sp. WS1]
MAVIPTAIMERERSRCHFDPAVSSLIAALAATHTYARVMIDEALSATQISQPVLTMVEKKLTVRRFDVVEIVGDGTVADAVGIHQHWCTKVVISVFRPDCN